MIRISSADFASASSEKCHSFARYYLSYTREGPHENDFDYWMQRAHAYAVRDIDRQAKAAIRSVQREIREKFAYAFGRVVVGVDLAKEGSDKTIVRDWYEISQPFQWPYVDNYVPPDHRVDIPDLDWSFLSTADFEGVDEHIGPGE